MSGIRMSDIPDEHLIAWCEPFARRGLSYDTALLLAFQHRNWKNDVDGIRHDADINAASCARFKRLYDGIPKSPVKFEVKP